MYDLFVRKHMKTAGSRVVQPLIMFEIQQIQYLEKKKLGKSSAGAN